MRKFLCVVVLAALLSGCGESGTLPSVHLMHERKVNLKDGRAVTCLITGEGGLSCDWVNAK